MFLVPFGDATRARRAVGLLWDLAVETGVLLPAGEPGHNSADWVTGGFGGARIDASETLRWYNSGQGGARVTCPNSNEPVIKAFSHQLSVAQGGGSRLMDCPRCAGVHSLDSLGFSPPSAFGHAALVLIGVENFMLNDAAVREATTVLDKFSVVLHRPGY
jgi:hypothetical protein